MVLYTELAQYYFDIEKPSRELEKEFRFLQSEFNKYNLKHILDAGCGTGEHVDRLRQMGYKVVGIDSSQEMISIAKNRFPNNEFHCDSMYTYNTDIKFDGIICIFGSFNYILETVEVNETLKSFFNLLKPGGILILEVWSALPLINIKKKPLTNVATVNSHNAVIHRNRGFRLLKSGSEVLVEVNYIYDINNKEIRDRHVMRAFYPMECRDYLKQNKFSLRNIYSNMDRERVTDRSSRIIFIAQKNV